MFIDDDNVGAVHVRRAKELDKSITKTADPCSSDISWIRWSYAVSTDSSCLPVMGLGCRKVTGLVDGSGWIGFDRKPSSPRLRKTRFRSEENLGASRWGDPVDDHSPSGESNSGCPGYTS